MELANKAAAVVVLNTFLFKKILPDMYHFFYLLALTRFGYLLTWLSLIDGQSLFNISPLSLKFFAHLLMLCHKQIPLNSKIVEII